MRRVVTTNRFDKEVKFCRKRGKDMARLDTLMRLLEYEEMIPLRCRDHSLIGNYAGRRECHIEPDWLL